MNDKCQQCGCDMWVEGPVYGMVTRHTPHGFDCIKLQLATVTAERDALKADQSDWRKGVAFIASALGEKDPPDLSCVRLALLAAEVTAERDALLEACKESLIVLALNGSLIVDPRHAITLVESAIAKCDPATAENGAGE